MILSALLIISTKGFFGVLAKFEHAFS